MHILPTPPKFQDDESSRNIQTFFKVVFGFIILINTTMLIAWLILPQLYLRWLMVIALLDLTTCSLLFLNSKGYNRIASILFILVCLLIIIGFAWSAGGMRAPGIQVFPVIVLLAGLLLGWKEGLITALAAVMSGLIWF
jgi:hypothetical protein